MLYDVWEAAKRDTAIGVTADLEKVPREEEGQAVTVVDWYGSDDPANPVNWPGWKKFMVYLTINYCSMTVYMAATTYTVSQTQIKEKFDVSTLVAASGVGFFIIGYGIGPMFWSPLSEISSIGRNIPYVLGMTLFIIISIPTALAKNIGGLLFLRSLQGLFGSPILSTGGASLTDIADLYNRPYSLFTWAISSLAGPSLGTIIAGFTTPVMGWRWTLWLIPIVNAPGLYMGLLYAIFYSFFEFFPLVYGNVYDMNHGQIGLMFLTVVISITIAGIPYTLCIHFVINKSLRSGKTMTPEDRLLPALVASLLIPVGLFLFAWTSRPSIHFMVPTIGVGLFASSLFSGNGFAKAMVAFCGVL
ncbi:hypothetical protein INS49_015641 [Diaporthe citri]|uniref:uncharacterized protein n=1 Tax=Diaporthe citri TaxID=83186 RepID=UPI001C7F95B0|nr:uncharacterized protein INS49_015641 [Diaporthe citri]KAG6356254.1 hypothetical protein INS49_015641 [Diaporthe citri]